MRMICREIIEGSAKSSESTSAASKFRDARMHSPAVVHVAVRARVFFEQVAIDSRGEKREKCQEYDHNDWLALNQSGYVPEVAERRGTMKEQNRIAGRT